jgi:hypothetical protein
MSVVLTEVQARGRWCPFSRAAMATAEGVLIHGLPAANRWQTDGKGDNLLPAGSMCIASACMAWRKRVSASDRDLRDSDDERIGKFEAGGYCGLAGRPE